MCLAFFRLRTQQLATRRSWDHGAQYLLLQCMWCMRQLKCSQNCLPSRHKTQLFISKCPWSKRRRKSVCTRSWFNWPDAEVRFLGGPVFKGATSSAKKLLPRSLRCFLNQRIRLLASFHCHLHYSTSQFWGRRKSLTAICPQHCSLSKMPQQSCPHLAPPVPCTLPSAVKRSKALRQHLRMRPSSVSCDKTMECVSPSLMNSRASPILCSQCQSSSITLWNSVLRTLHSCATLGGWFQNRPWIVSRNGKLQDISQPLCRTSPWQPFHDLRRSENTGQTWKIGGKAWIFWCIPTPQHCLEYVSTTKHTKIRQRGQIWPCDVSWVLHKHP